MRSVLQRAVGLCALLLCLPALAENPPYLGEQLSYTVSYKGVLSAMNQVEIADAVLETERFPEFVDDTPVYRSAFRVSTEAYGEMERFYPLRYRFESFFTTDHQRTLLFDKQKKARKDRREIVWLDWEQREAKRFKARKPIKAQDSKTTSSQPKQEDLPPALAKLVADEERFREKDGAKFGQLNGILDHLSMLQSVRVKDLSLNSVFELAVLDGEEVLSYKVSVVKQEQLKLQGKSWQTFKLRFDAYPEEAYLEDGEEPELSQPPIYVWVTSDERRIPVRFASHYALGRFSGQLTSVNSISSDLDRLAALRN